MPKAFDSKKKSILKQLSVPEGNYADLSPKGSVDEGVRELCDEINQLDGYVTTSSCAGRVAVFLEGRARPLSLEESNLPTASLGGKGGGRWLFVSHEPVDMTKIGSDLPATFGLTPSSEVSYPMLGTSPRFVHFKFEPMILHILTSSLRKAQHALSAAMAAGFRESGISGIVGDEPTPMVAVRTQGLAFDCLVAYEGAQGGLQSMVSEEYLRTLVQLANQRFATNAGRKERFRSALLKPNIAASDWGSEGGWEPADVRRDRKRAEGLRRREEGLKKTAEASQQQGHEDDQYSTDLLINAAPP